MVIVGNNDSNKDWSHEVGVQGRPAVKQRGQVSDFNVSATYMK